jgi:HEAT repeat protein
MQSLTRIRRAIIPYRKWAMNPSFLIAFTAASAVSAASFPSDQKHFNHPRHSVEYWAAQLSDHDLRTRRDAAYALGLLGPAAESTVPALIRRTDDDDVQVQIAAVDALGLIGPPAQAAVPALMKKLRDDRLETGGFPFRSSHHAARALALIGAPAVTPLTAVLNEQVLNERGERARKRAVDALMRMGPSAAGSVPALLRLVRDKDGRVDEGVLDALGRIGPGAAEAVPVLETLLRNEGYMDDGVLKSESLRIIRTLSLVGGRPTHELTKDLISRDPLRRCAAIAAIRYFGAGAKTIVPSLLLSFKDENLDRGGLTPEEFSDLFEGIQTESALAVGEINPGPEAVQNLIVLLRRDQHTDPNVVYALGRIGPAAMPAVPELTGALEHSREDVRMTIIKVLPFIDTNGRVVVPALTRALRDTNRENRGAAITALGRIGPGARKAVLAITRALKEEGTRQMAAMALGRIGPEAREAVPALVDALRDTSVRPAAADALRRIGPAAKIAIPVLREFLRDDPTDASVAAALVRLDPKNSAIVAGLAENSEHDVFRAIVKSALGEKTPEGRGIVHQALTGIDDALVAEYQFEGGWRDGSQAILAALDRIADLPRESQTALPKVAELLDHKSMDVRARAKQLVDDMRDGNAAGIQALPQPR